MSLTLYRQSTLGKTLMEVLQELQRKENIRTNVIKSIRNI